MKNKLIKSLLLLTSLFAFSSCDNNEGTTTNPTTEDIEYKTSLGKDALFDESTGYQNEDPCLLEINANTRYVYYTRNLNINSGSDECICFKKGLLVNGEWKYGESSIVLKTSNSGWDSKHIYAPSVIKGDFLYNNKMYRYLMAYAGTTENDRVSSQIGFALATRPDEEFIKVGTAPIVTYNKSDWTNSASTAEGVTNPSLVSKDGSNQIWLFYSFMSPITTSSSRVLEFDLSGDMKNLVSYSDIEGLYVNNKGVVEGSTVPTLLDADYAYEVYSNTLFSVADYHSGNVTVKPYKTSAVAAYKADLDDVIYSIPNPETEITGWEYLDNITTQDTKGDETGKIGYSRIYSACIVKDAYGHIELIDKLNIIITVSQTAQQNSTYVFDTQFLEISLEVGGNE